MIVYDFSLLLFIVSFSYLRELDSHGDPFVLHSVNLYNRSLTSCGPASRIGFQVSEIGISHTQTHYQSDGRKQEAGSRRRNLSSYCKGIEFWCLYRGATVWRNSAFNLLAAELFF